MDIHSSFPTYSLIKPDLQLSDRADQPSPHINAHLVTITSQIPPLHKCSLKVNVTLDTQDSYD